MSEIAIKVKNLSKCYRIGGPVERYRTFRDTLMDIPKALLRRLRGGHAYQDETIWALKDVSFEVKQGEVIGIIGRNGAGKTTLLKVLSRITEPTTGRAVIQGRVGSLLEVGTGFHPELTGRENIYLNGAILGMHKIEINRKFDDIIGFAEIEKFIDTPLKRYSSGMYVRLAFAVAAHLDPEILLVDEVLAVGDVEFQKKCMGKMESISKKGRTVLFISHNMSAINNLCNRAILLDEGRLKLSGDTNTVVSEYISGATKGDLISNVSFEEDYGKPVQILNLALIRDDGSVNSTIEYNDRVTLKVKFVVRESNKDYYVALAIIDFQGITILFSSDEDVEMSTQLSTLKPGKYTYQIPFPTKLFKPGKYYVHISFNQKKKEPIDQKRNLLSFEIIDTLSYRASSSSYRHAVVAPEIQWTLR